MRNRIAYIPLTLAILLSLLPSTAAAQTTAALNYSWTAPTTGSQVVRYVVEHSVNGGPFVQIGTTTSPSYTLQAAYGSSHRIRVAGVDAQSRQGIFSTASTAYTPDPGAPGQPGQPIPIF